MNKILIVNQSNTLFNNISILGKNNPDLSFEHVASAVEATEFIDNNTVAVVILSVSLAVINGDELADYINSLQPDVRFIFIYDEANVETALNLFNRYDDSVIYNIKGINIEKLYDSVLNQLSAYIAEIDLEQRNISSIEREKLYMKSMNEMSSLLNSRIECYKVVLEIYLKSLKTFFSTWKQQNILNDIIEKSQEFLSKYIEYMLVEPPNFDRIVEDINSSYGRIEVETNARPKSQYTCSRLYMIMYMYNYVFTCLFDNFEFNFELRKSDTIYRIDVSLEQSSEYCDDSIKDIINMYLNVFTKLCDRFDRVTADNIVHHHYYIVDR